MEEKILIFVFKFYDFNLVVICWYYFMILNDDLELMLYKENSNINYMDLYEIYI